MGMIGGVEEDGDPFRQCSEPLDWVWESRIRLIESLCSPLMEAGGVATPLRPKW
jgi:hypothetical protein